MRIDIYLPKPSRVFGRYLESKINGSDRMRIYLAGGITGNLFPLWKKWGGQDESIDFKRVMDIYLVNPSSRPYTIERNEYLLSGGASRKKRNGDGHENYRGGAGFDTYP